MIGAEIFIVYGFPAMLVVGGALLVWRNHVVMKRARARDRETVPVADAGPSVSRQEIENVLAEMHTGPQRVTGRMASAG